MLYEWKGYTYTDSDMYMYHPQSDCYYVIKKGSKIESDIDMELSFEITKEKYLNKNVYKE